jgi:hypothetical protein
MTWLQPEIDNKFQQMLSLYYSPFFDGIECMFSEWKHYVKVGLQGHWARDEEDLQTRIRAFQLDPAHATAYCRQ